MENTNPTRCRACLLRDTLNKEEYRKTILRVRENLSPRLLASDALYESRLALCTSCEHLQNGTCMRCGCLVEMRAMRTDQHCPPPLKHW